MEEACQYCQCRPASGAPAFAAGSADLVSEAIARLHQELPNLVIKVEEGTNDLLILAQQPCVRSAYPSALMI